MNAVGLSGRKEEEIIQEGITGRIAFDQATGQRAPPLFYISELAEGGFYEVGRSFVISASKSKTQYVHLCHVLTKPGTCRQN